MLTRTPTQVHISVIFRMAEQKHSIIRSEALGLPTWGERVVAVVGKLSVFFFFFFGFSIFDMNDDKVDFGLRSPAVYSWFMLCHIVSSTSCRLEPRITNNAPTCARKGQDLALAPQFASVSEFSHGM